MTNTHQTEDASVEFVYVDGEDCDEFNRTEWLTQADTFSCWTYAHCPEPERGFVYLFCKSPATGEPVAFNRLIGWCTVMNGLEHFGYSTEPFAFKGMVTDLDGDHVRDLDGLEYRMAPDRLLFPRFLGQNYGTLSTDLILMNLTGSRQFSASVSFGMYNDNTKAFRSTYDFHC